MFFIKGPTQAGVGLRTSPRELGSTTMMVQESDAGGTGDKKVGEPKISPTPQSKPRKLTPKEIDAATLAEIRRRAGKRRRPLCDGIEI